MPKPTGAADAPALPTTTRRGLLKSAGALGTAAALAVPAAILPPERVAAAAAGRLSPVFAALQRERTRLQLAADATAAAVADDAGEEDADEQAAQAALAALWAMNERLMGTPAAVAADLGLKGWFLAEQLAEFGDVEHRYAVALVADLRRLFPLADGAGGGRP